MTQYKYSFKTEGEGFAKAVIKEADISTKHAIEISSRIRNKSVKFAKQYLEEVIKMERVVKFTRFTNGAGHKTGIGSGKYPIKASKLILRLVKLVESNATNHGLGSDLKIAHLSAKKGGTAMHYGRQRGIHMKRTHMEIVVKEKKTTPKPKETLRTESSVTTEMEDISEAQKQKVSVTPEDKPLSTPEDKPVSEPVESESQEPKTENVASATVKTESKEETQSSEAASANGTESSIMLKDKSLGEKEIKEEKK